MRAKFYTTTLDVAGIEPGPSAQRFPLPNASCASNVEFKKCWQFKNNIATQRNTYLLFRKVVSRKRGAFIEFDAEEKKVFLSRRQKHPLLNFSHLSQEPQKFLLQILKNSTLSKNFKFRTKVKKISRLFSLLD